MKRFGFMAMALAFALAFVGCDTGNNGGSGVVREMTVTAQTDWRDWGGAGDNIAVSAITTTGTLHVLFQSLDGGLSMQELEALAVHASAIVATLDPKTTTFGGNRSFEIGEMEPFDPSLWYNSVAVYLRLNGLIN